MPPRCARNVNKKLYESLMLTYTLPLTLISEFVFRFCLKKDDRYARFQTEILNLIQNQNCGTVIYEFSVETEAGCKAQVH